MSTLNEYHLNQVKNNPISKATANRLMALYREMDAVKPGQYNQNDCTQCLLGHCMLNGVTNGYTDAILQFDEAVAWVGLDHTMQEMYLFGDYRGVAGNAEILGLPGKSTTPKQAQTRIKALLNLHGYEVVWSDS